MRSLEQIHLDELESTTGTAINLGYSYACRLAQAAADRYDRNFGVFEDRGLPMHKVNRYVVGHSYSQENELVLVQEPTTVRPPASPEEIEAARPAVFKVGDRINYTAPGAGPMWQGSLVTGIVGPGIFQGQLEVTATNGNTGIIAQASAELAPSFPDYERRQADDALSSVERAVWSMSKIRNLYDSLGEQLGRVHLLQGKKDRRLASRSTEYALVGTYEIVIEGAGFDPKPHLRYRRLNYTSVKQEVVSSKELADQLTDALNTVAFMEHDLDPAAVMSVVRADRFEEDQEEGIVI